MGNPKMAKRKSATRRNKSFKNVDPYRKGKSTKGLGTDIGFDYGEGGPQIPGNVKNLEKKKRKKITDKEKEMIDKKKKKSEVHKLMMEGSDKPDAKIRFVQRSYESNYEFKNRMHQECQNAITIVNSTKNRNVVKEYIRAQKQDKNAIKVDQLNQQQKVEKESRKKNDGKKLTRKTQRLEALKEIKKSEKLEKQLEKAEKAAQSDPVKFGEVVHAPPTFSKLPRGSDPSKHKPITNLLLMDKLKGVTEP